jgi:hypothetical protein
MSRIVVALLVVAVAAGAAAEASLATAPTITQSSIAGVRLGVTMAQAKALLGKALQRSVGTHDNPGQPDNWIRVASDSREVAVYFEKGDAHAVMVTTWNSSDRTAAAIGPCSPRGTVKKAYGSALKQSSHTDKGGGYTLGKHLFIGYDSGFGLAPRVTAIGLYAPSVAEFAAFVTLSEVNCGQ